MNIKNLILEILGKSIMIAMAVLFFGFIAMGWPTPAKKITYRICPIVALQNCEMTEKYRERNGCVTFKTLDGRSVVICSNYKIETLNEPKKDKEK